ncbi:hypothetical protein [Holospora undulata]|uniref:Uncharacterized protein n=1 Tax=Holospora undulata HU1 TaxID=1321371 RepID=A0A061JIH8_9PROT|nr:hypothetical protein [Holospora undulata]ETZ05378.1 hypothetical protein K737_300187 [Holospora undulata HU1]
MIKYFILLFIFTASNCFAPNQGLLSNTTPGKKPLNDPGKKNSSSQQGSTVTVLPATPKKEQLSEKQLQSLQHAIEANDRLDRKLNEENLLEGIGDLPLKPDNSTKISQQEDSSNDLNKCRANNKYLKQKINELNNEIIVVREQLLSSTEREMRNMRSSKEYMETLKEEVKSLQEQEKGSSTKKQKSMPLLKPPHKKIQQTPTKLNTSTPNSPPFKTK